MRARWLPCLVALALPAAAAAQAPPDQTPQALFEDLIVKDTRTTQGVRQLLQSDAGFVGARPVFADLTGDGRMDAIVEARVPGAAGTVAVYVFSTDGTRADRLRAVFRSQALYRARTSIAGATLTVSEPRWARGDDICCPSGRTDRSYAWDARTHTLRRR
ncbi:MAG: hypothetical protein QOH46_2115 [Solirubrobacteraceae bacterium]|jgi:hypothetical protein|nr:hypothetical protein [Solirubrobacteraceae bacterium]